MRRWGTGARGREGRGCGSILEPWEQAAPPGMCPGHLGGEHFGHVWHKQGLGGGRIRTWGCSVCTSCTLVLNHSAQPTRLPHAGRDFSFLFGLKIPWGVSPRPGRGLPCPPGRPPSSHPIAGRAWRGAGGGIPILPLSEKREKFPTPLRGAGGEADKEGSLN